MPHLTVTRPRNASSLLASTLVLLLFTAVPAMGWSQSELPPNDEQNQEDQGDQQAPDQYYAQYADQAMQLFHKGDSSKAIDLMTKAFQLAPTNTTLINNLAACYIQRGVYYQNTKKDYQHAIEDYREALFYLVHEWPSSATRTPTSQENIKIIEDNLNGAMKSLNIPVNDAKWHLQSAWDLRRKGQLQQAMVEYARVTEINPRNSEAWAAMGDIYTVRQKPDKAMNAFQKAIDSASNPSDALYVKLGTALLKNESPEKAVAAYNQALALNPKNKDALLDLEQIWTKEITLNPRNMSAHLNLGAVDQQLGRFDDAYAQYQVADRLSPNNPLIKLNLGSLNQAKGNLDEAVAMYDAVLQQNPGNAQALLYKADILKQQGKGGAAEQVLQQALKTSPDKKQILDQLMAVYKTQGDPAKITSGWQLYSDTFPEDASVQYQAGLALHEQKDYDGAIAYYQKAVSLKPDMSEAYANLGTALHAVNRDDEAVKALQKALSLNPNLEDVQSLVAAINQHEGSQALVEAAQLHEQGKYAEAAKGYEAALKQDPKNPDIYSRYGLALQALKRFPDALNAYDKAIALDANNAAYYYYKGSVYDEQDQLEPAQKLYEKALSLDPNLAQAKQALDALKSSGADSQLAQALDAYNQKNYLKAMQLAEQVLKSDPKNATAYYYKGLVLDAQKKLEPARLAYTQAISLDPTLSDAVYALAVVLDTQGKKPDAKKTYQQFIELMKDQPEDAFIKYAKERVAIL